MAKVILATYSFIPITTLILLAIMGIENTPIRILMTSSIPLVGVYGRQVLGLKKVLLGHKNGDITTHYSEPEIGGAFTGGQSGLRE